MAALIRGETVNCGNPKLDIYMKDNSGALSDVAELSFQIFERVTMNGTPKQLYPSSGRHAVNLNPCPAGDRIGIGHYAARYTVPGNAVIGTWEIKWFARKLSSSPEQFYVEEFEVLPAGTTTASDLYVSVADVRAQGVNSNPPDDARIFESIKLWQSVIERATRQWFRPVATEFYLDGADSDMISLPVPIISIESLRLNGSDDPLETERYKVYSGRQMPDDRTNPRIKLVGGYNRNIFAGPDRNRARFFRGRQNQYIKGVFGYVEPDGSAPPLIKRALMRLVLKDLAVPLVSGTGTGLTPPAITTGIVQEEWTDGHQIKYAVSGGELKPRAAGLAGLIDDPEVQQILRLYRAPIALGAPNDPTIEW